MRMIALTNFHYHVQLRQGQEFDAEDLHGQIFLERKIAALMPENIPTTTAEPKPPPPKPKVTTAKKRKYMRRDMVAED